MAVVPPSYAFGDLSNDSPYAPVVWTDIQPTQNATISQSSMPYASVVEFKGYYRAEATGTHKFRLSGSTGVTGYSWVSGAPSSSDRIVTADGQAGMRLTNDRSYGIKIPTVASTIFQNASFTGQSPFIGAGPWPRNGYGTASNTVVGPNATNNNGPGRVVGGTAPGTNAQTELYPGQIRRFPDKADRPDYYTHNACCDQWTVGSWAFPESEQFGTAPLVDERYETGTKDCCDASRTASNVPSAGYASNYFRKAFLDGNFKAEGFDYEDVATWQGVSGRAAHIIWPENPLTGAANPNNRDIERVAISFTLNTRIEDTYTFKFQTYDQIKIWKKVATGNTIRQRNLISKLEPTVGENPIFAGTSVDGNATQRGASTDGMWEFEAEITMGGDDSRGVWIMGYCTGEPSQDTHGWGLLVYNSAGDLVWDSSKLINAGEQFVGIDECGYNAYLGDDDRIEQFRDSESYTLDGWKGFSNTDIFTADERVGDDKLRSVSDTRQYLPSNSLTRCRDSEVVEGGVYLRQGDYYFIRTIVTNSSSDPANFSFNVTDPQGLNRTVKFSGNGDPNYDPTVGGSAGGNGIPINTTVLCGSVLTTTSGNNLNFAMIDRFGVVLNLSALGVPSTVIGLEGQDTVVDDESTSGEYLVELDEIVSGEGKISVPLTTLLRGNFDQFTEMDEDQIRALTATYNRQRTTSPTPQTLDYETFRSAITSQAVIQWGSGGNYPYIYHSVDDTITAICSGSEIIVPNNTSNLTRNKTTTTVTTTNTNTAPDCFDMDLSVLSDTSAGITTKCFDECPKDPTQYPLLKHTVRKSDYDSLGFVSGWYDRIDAKPGYETPGTGNILESDESKLIPGYTGGQEVWRKGMSSRTESTASVLCGPGKILSIPWTVSDIYYPEDWNPLEKELLVSGPRIEWSSNTYFYDPDNTEGGDHDWNDTFQKGLIIFWISDIAGGPRSGNYSGMGTPSWATTPKIWTTYNYDLYQAAIADPDTYRGDFVSYAGNTYGTRWMNFVVLNQAKLKARPQTNPNYDKYNLPEPGTQDFVDMFEVYGYKTNEFRMFDSRPVPNCDLIQNAKPDSTIQSLPNMYDFIGPEFTGTTTENYIKRINNGMGRTDGKAGIKVWSSRNIGPSADFYEDYKSSVKRKLYTPLDGTIHSWRFGVHNSQKWPAVTATFTYDGQGGNPLDSCSPALSTVAWFSYVPGGEPIKNKSGSPGTVLIVGTATGSPSMKLYQLYDINEKDTGTSSIIPVVTREYWFNFAVVDATTAGVCAANSRAPLEGELREFDPDVCLPSNTVDEPYVMAQFDVNPVYFSDWLLENS